VMRQYILEVVMKRPDLVWNDWVYQLFTSPAHKPLCDCKRAL
jgi:hypothetical protein